MSTPVVFRRFALAGLWLAASWAGAGLAPTGALPGGELEDIPPGGDAVTARLRELRFELGSALDEMKKADPKLHGDFIPGLLAEMNLVFGELAKAETYMRAHLDENPLPPRPPVYVTAGGALALPLSAGANLATPKFAGAYPSLAAAQRHVRAGLDTFVNGRADRGRGIMGEIGGSRDALLRRVGAVEARLAEAAQNMMRDLPPQSLRAGSPPAGARGSISGEVRYGDQPMAFVLVSFQTVREFTAPRLPVPGSAQADALARAAAEGRPPPAPPTVSPSSIYNGGLPATITNAQGKFIIRDLPPEGYIVTVYPLVTGVVMYGSRQPVEVKPGVETKLDAPIVVQQRGGRGT